MTKAEAILWIHIKNKQINGFRFLRQFSINKYIVDFYCPKKRLVIEVDGPTHLYKKGFRLDIKKDEYIKKLGIGILRFSNDEIYGDLIGVIEKINKYVTTK